MRIELMYQLSPKSVYDIPPGGGWEGFGKIRQLTLYKFRQPAEMSPISNIRTQVRRATNGV